MVGLNQSFYGEDWKEFLGEAESNGIDITENSFRKINFSIINEYEYGVLEGLKYLNYGYDIEYDGSVYEDSTNTTLDREDLKDELELNDYDYRLIGQYYVNIRIPKFVSLCQFRYSL